MNSYPHEFLAHPQPLMFVAGLSTASSSSTQNRDRSSSVVSSSSFSAKARRPSDALDPSSAAGSVGLSLTSPLTSPGPTQHQLPSSPPAENHREEILQSSVREEGQGGAEEDESERDKEFRGLVENLRGALVDMGGKGKVWLPDDQRKDFRIILVDKGVRLPLRKIASSSSDSQAVPHSPLSPLTPSSPVAPDGLIAPVWVRKHAELVPSVFVLFLRLYESPLTPESETPEEKERREGSEKIKEKDMDDLLVREIGDRRRRLGERGIKLTVVLMASAATLDSPSLDPRLSYIRRASALASKASLFVLTPVPAEQLPDFVNSLQEALYESAIEYYGSHAKRVRRKRTRLPVGQYGVQPIPGEKGRPLGSQGWAVRYDWKAGWFAEIRGEFDAARRHYEDCWNELARMFASTQTLPPRTKRWAEAKVLADCVAIRICKLLLYEGETARVTTPFFVHLKRFGDLSRGWGIGEDTFEYWSWIARQYRIFAELLEMGLQAGISLPPFPLPAFPTSAPPTGVPPPDYWTTPTSSTDPIQVLQQPAFYFFTAATCSVQRQKRYEEALEVENDALRSEAGSTAGYVATAPGFANEKKVDHSSIVIELFTKAYSLFKEQRYPQDRAALYIAYRIAEAYSQSNQHEMAMKFFGRISNNFKIGKWDPFVRQIRILWYECAQRTGNVEIAARLLVEMMCPGSGVEDEERVALQDDLTSLLKTTAPSTTDPIVVDIACPQSLLNVQTGFWTEETTIPNSAPFQLVLACPPDVNISGLDFQELHISFSDNRPDVIIKSSSAKPTGDIDLVNLGNIGENTTDTTAPLNWQAGQKLVFTGQLNYTGGEVVHISTVKIILKEGSWNLHLIFIPSLLDQWITAKGPLSTSCAIPLSAKFVPKTHSVSLELVHHPSAFIDEALQIAVKITSDDDRSLDGKLSVFLHPGDEEDDSTIEVDDTSSRTLLENISIASLQPGSSSEKLLHLKSGQLGTKVIDLSLHTSVAGEENGPVEEKIETIVIPVLSPYDFTSTITFQPCSGIGERSALVTSILRSHGPRPLQVQDLSLEAKDDDVKLISSSLDSIVAPAIPKVWDSTTSFAIYSQFQLQSTRRSSSAGKLPDAPAQLVVKWYCDNPSLATQTILPLPPLALPINDSFISGLMEPPPFVNLHQAFSLPLTLTNSHPTYRAVLNIETSTAEAFVWKGNRNTRLSELAPGETRKIEVEMIAVGQIGWCLLPKITVWEERGEDERREVRISNSRSEGQRGDGVRVYVRP